MKIIVCCKVVPEEQDIAVKSDRSLDISKAAAKISQYDLNAVECAVELAGKDGEVIALSAGPKKWLDGSKIRKDILSRGPSSLQVVVDDSLDGALPAKTADVLAAAAKKTGFDLILFGEGSGDLYAQQVGLLVGEKLGIPTINAVSAINMDGDKVIVERALEKETEVLEMPMPAALCVTSDINVPRIPTMKAILAAGKKAVNAVELASLGVEAKALSDMESILAPQGAERLNKITEGDGDDVVAAFAEQIKKVLQ